MSAAAGRPGSSGRKLITRVELPPGPAAAFRDVDEPYLRSGPLNLDEIVRRIDTADAEDSDVLGVPRRDVPQAHDMRLAAAVAAGKSRLVVQVGGSSTGKTRACWEAVQALPERWRCGTRSPRPGPRPLRRR
ncbi:hypothetical protein GCM10010170_076580 [Dactylosporangium salmoneum]|uniref:Uncharacterized protein n=1 Tax=Dactylosporangium salmoneum TaxID=53361 RepID=A0ABN3HBB7_9ACTN